MKLPVSYFNMVQIKIYHVYIITMPPSYSSLGLYLQIWDIFVFITGHIKVDFFIYRDNRPVLILITICQSIISLKPQFFVLG